MYNETLKKLLMSYFNSSNEAPRKGVCKLTVTSK